MLQCLHASHHTAYEFCGSGTCLYCSFISTLWTSWLEKFKFCQCSWKHFLGWLSGSLDVWWLASANIFRTHHRRQNLPPLEQRTCLRQIGRRSWSKPPRFCLACQTSARLHSLRTCCLDTTFILIYDDFSTFLFSTPPLFFIYGDFFYIDTNLSIALK
jgi:hypothetical protein